MKVRSGTLLNPLKNFIPRNKLTMFEIIVIAIVGACIFGIISAVKQIADEKEARKDAQYAMSRMPVSKGAEGTGKRASIMPSNMLVDVKGRGGIAIDTQNQQIGILRNQLSQPSMIPYRDLLSSEIIEDGETVTKTSRGSQLGGVLIGGLALGGVGAIIGGLSGSSKSFDKVSKIALMITINDVKNPVHYVMFLDDGIARKKSHAAYKNAMGEAQKWHGKLKVVIHQADREDRQQEQKETAKTVVTVPQESLADELAKMSELRDRGILTEKEFASQKAKLLKA